MRAMLALALLIGAAPASAQDRPQVINVPLSRPGEPIKLDIDILSARIEVIGEAREDAMFEVSVTEGKRKIITPSGAQSIKGGGYTFEIDEDDNEISLDTDWRANKVSVLARVPRRADVELQTVNDGELFISNITGNIELYNTNGPITAKNISGSVIAESINDTIDVSFGQVDGGQASSFESINGDLYLRIPARAGVEVHLDSSRGEIYSDFEVEIVPTEKKVQRNEDGSGTSIRIENVIVARINGGGPAIRLKTLHGDIHILKAE
jgi:hypothetical protein